MNVAICIIAYNRIDSLQRVLSSVSEACYDQEVTLIISIDKSKNSAVEDYADAYLWNHGAKYVIKHSENLGLRKHVLECGDRVKGYDALIVLEDDVTVAESFFIYTKQCVAKYKDDDKIAGISLYSFPLSYHCQVPFTPLQSDSDVFLMKCAQSWGQIWMPRQWATFRNWYESHSEEFTLQPHLPRSICSWPKSSWLKYHTRYCIEQNKYFVYPYVALSTNNCDAGTHNAKSSTMFQTKMLYGFKNTFNLNPTVKYDGFFESELLYDVLNLSPEECCLDFYGDKQNREGKRYWLSREIKNYKIIKSYALQLKPFELNIINGRDGDDLFLYDTSVVQTNKHKYSYNAFIEYLYSMNIKAQIKKYLKDFINKLV